MFQNDGGRFLNITNRKFLYTDITTIFHVCPLEGLLQKHFHFFNVEVSYTLQRICFKEQNFSVKLFAYAKFGYRTVSNFNNTKLENLPNVKLLKLEISTFGLFCLFCQY